MAQARSDRCGPAARQWLIGMNVDRPCGCGKVWRRRKKWQKEKAKGPPSHVPIHSQLLNMQPSQPIPKAARNKMAKGVTDRLRSCEALGMARKDMARKGMGHALQPQVQGCRQRLMTAVDATSKGPPSRVPIHGQLSKPQHFHPPQRQLATGQGWRRVGFGGWFCRPARGCWASCRSS